MLTVSRVTGPFLEQVPGELALKVSERPTIPTGERTHGSHECAPVARAARRRDRDEPFGSPRNPRRGALSTRCQVSPGACGIGPDFCNGHLPWTARWASAQARISGMRRGGRFIGLRSSRSCSRSRASEEPPGSPRRPFRRAWEMAFQLSPGASTTGPDLIDGHDPVRAR